MKTHTIKINDVDINTYNEKYTNYYDILFIFQIIIFCIAMLIIYNKSN